MIHEKGEIIVRMGEMIPESIEDGKYIISLARHEGSLVGPLVSKQGIEKRATELGYHANRALEDIRITGPFKHLNLARGL
ncbi:hypothetical protein HYT23_06395 [Candidatus Pacearchaeota archaeon]|nr:hypothetical protein [Candidatus Pacearchaeota archaeon]